MRTKNLHLPDSKHFRLQQLADGVYAAIHIDGGAAISNAGIIDLGGRTLIFDTFLAPQAAKDLRAAAEILTGHSVDFVINSHWHNDHIWGNQVFDTSTDIISTEETRRLIITASDTKTHEDLVSPEIKLEAERTKLATVQDEVQRRQIVSSIDLYQAFVNLKPIIRVRAPNLGFNQQLTIQGTERTAELINYAGGHTESDVILFLPKEGIVFMGDLLFINFHPYLGGGDPDRLQHNLEAVLNLDPKVLVPGHGPVGTAESLTQMMEFIRVMDDLAIKMIKDGKAENTIDALEIPKLYSNWLYGSFFSPNMHFLYKRHLRMKGIKEA